MEQNLIDSIVKSYSFVWFRGVRGRHAERRLERMMQRYPRSADAIPNLRAFKGGYGMIVCRDYIPTLQSIMSQIFRRSRMDLEYPSSDRNFDSRYWGYPSPNGLYSAWFHKLGTCTSEIAIALNEYANSTSFDSQASSNRDIYGGRTYSFLVDESSFQRNFFPDDEMNSRMTDTSCFEPYLVTFRQGSISCPDYLGGGACP
uniref:Uncharacterized protein n=1 Tax=Talaromyces marneffei PM1 TaxID=1077442 RepID=A0A093VJL3_TALMA